MKVISKKEAYQLSQAREVEGRVQKAQKINRRLEVQLRKEGAEIDFFVAKNPDITEEYQSKEYVSIKKRDQLEILIRAKKLDRENIAPLDWFIDIYQAAEEIKVSSMRYDGEGVNNKGKVKQYMPQYSKMKAVATLGQIQMMFITCYGLFALLERVLIKNESCRFIEKKTGIGRNALNSMLDKGISKLRDCYDVLG